MYLEYNYSQLCDIALAGLLHDIGREFDKDDTSSNHTQKGIELLRNTSVFSITCTAVAFQHHENYNGTDFQTNKKDDISEFSRIVSVADYFIH